MIAAYTALHYGTDYLSYAILSIIDYVDVYVVLYAPTGSHGHGAPVPCPETRADLYRLAKLSAGRKLLWIDGRWTQEGQQRDSIHEIVPDASLIIPVDYDEIWQPGLPQLAIATAGWGKVRNWRVPFRHYWRSFRRCVLYDPAYPVRIINPRMTTGEATLETNGLAVNHMGYAISPAMMDYKWQVHGHKNELRKDCDWYNDVYLANRQTDCHPVGSEYWNPETVDPWQYMPRFMREHEWADCEVIE